MDGEYFIFGLVLIVNCLFIDGSIVRSCRDVQTISKQTTDGEYCISVNGSEQQGSLIYCHDMGTYDPKEFLTLPRGAEENLSITSKAQTCSIGKIMYKKVGLNLQTMVVNSWDDTFAISDVDVTKPWCDSQPLFGRAFACPSPIGVVKVDLRETGFFIPQTVTWQAYGNHAIMNLAVQTTQTIHAECTGSCGGCEPRNAAGETTYHGELHDKVMPIGYDVSLDPNACSL